MAVPSLEELSQTLTRLADLWDEAGTAAGWLPTAGSEAAALAAGEPVSPETAWGPAPIGTALGTSVLLGQAAVDHLRALADDLAPRARPFASVTTVRAVAELSARAWWLLAPGQDASEVVRRWINERLYGLLEERRMVLDVDPLDPDGSAAALTARIDALVEEARSRQLPTNHDRRLGWHVGGRRPSATRLVGLLIDDEGSPGLGSLSYRTLSTSAHGTLTGLARHFAALVADPPRGAYTAYGYVRPLTPEEAAMRGVVGPLAFYQFAGHMCLRFGWQFERVRVDGEAQLRTWQAALLGR